MSAYGCYSVPSGSESSLRRYGSDDLQALETPATTGGVTTTRQSEQSVRVPNDESPPPHSFLHKFDRHENLPQFVGLSRKEAEDLAREQGFATPVLELPVTEQVAWRAERRADRLNLVVQDGRVIRTAVF